MKIHNALGLVMSFILAVVAYFATSNIIIGGGSFIVSFAFYYLYVLKRIECHVKTVTKIHECYLFINNFLISLSIKESLVGAYEAVEDTISDEFKDFIEGIKNLGPIEKLVYLKKYFPFHIYSIFVDVVTMWMEEGGNILEMSQQITDELREIEEFVTFSQSVGRRKGIEIAVLWMFSLTIVIVLRISLKDFYYQLSKQLVYVASIGGLVIVVLLSIMLFIGKWTKLEIEGININEQLEEDN